MATTDDTTAAGPGNPQQLLNQFIDPSRAKMLQAHAVMVCLREALLYAEGDDTVIFAEAANAAAALANDATEGLDSVRLRSMLETLSHEPSSVDS
jgi:hypothetical protein